MKKLFLFFFSISFVMSYSQDLPTTRYESSQGRQTPEYEEIIDWWKKADAISPYIHMTEMGPTDAGYPLHLVLISWDKDFDIVSIKRKKKAVILINNGIHPGEPDGIDASMLLAKELVDPTTHLPENIVFAIIPVYNIGGALNRSSNYRVDQNGPEEFGFRGNSQNLDLNRDFIKCDSKEALSFAEIFHYLDPDVFVDNHVSNGADYQHTMTLIATQHNHLGGNMGKFMNQTFEPEIYSAMKQKGWDLVPYVNHFGETPEKGWEEFWDSPRYSSGYAALWNTFAFVPETHMLKPYIQRVDATKDLMKSFIRFTSDHSEEIISLRSAARQQQKTQPSFPIAWKLDRSVSTEILFKGYGSGYKTSEVSGLPRLYYDRAKPFEKKIPFYNHYIDTLSVSAPRAYIIPQGWWKVIDRLKSNNIEMHQMEADTSFVVEAYRIENYRSSPRPYEGHHINSGVEVSVKSKKMNFRKGDWYIPMDQKGNRFLIETLEPQAHDSYFAWNFFDPILAQKEGFSGYVFEETAAALLKKHPDIRKLLEEKKSTDSTFAKSARAQLNFVYQHSPYYEPAHMEYPVYRILK